MKAIIAVVSVCMSLSAYAMTDQDICEAYGVAIASNSTHDQVHFFDEIRYRIENKSWSLSSEECNNLSMEAKYEFDVDLMIEMGTD
ncbi:hypothetical protein [Vibrio celticus]|uniref:PepSY domain-containing protein n=1 Tax=Vibrio celticus TaxID=446372 RepID=A0A1C3JKW2_9VIBR|nr:hypothetical protein [Vibrio celticus]SBT15725.1 hypothetical protein VCE7224_04530 [Vibrio celticus]